MIINFYILCPLMINRIEGKVQSLRVIRHKFHRIKKDKKALNQMVTNTMEVKPKLEEIEPKLVNYINPHEDDMGAQDAAHLLCF